MLDLFGNKDDFNLSSGANDKAKVEEIQKAILVEQQKAQMNAQVREISEICWDKCVDKISTRLGGKTEQCILNCVHRFFDTSIIIKKSV